MNWLGLWTLCLRETRRFWKVGMQTLFAPVVSSLLMLFVFKLAFGQGNGGMVGGVPFETFLAPGVVMMAILNNAFANTSSSLIIAKVQGNSVDFLMPPLSPMELTLGFLSGAVTRGILVGLVTYAAVWIMQITPFQVANLFAVLYFAVIASLLMGAVGLMGGIWADKFDHMAAVQNFVIMPLTMLSGTFYPISRLPEPFVTISHYNPFFQIIDGFRYGFTGHAEGDLWLGGADVRGDHAGAVRVVLGDAEARLQAEGVTRVFRNDCASRLTCVGLAFRSFATAILITADRA